MDANQNLAYFGEVFIKNVRIRIIEHFEEVIKGKIKSSNALDLHANLAKFSKEELEFIKKLIENVVDESLFKMLFMFEEGEWTIVEKTAIADCDVEGLDEISEGWLASYH
jgi:hypothetical protein